MFVSHERSCLRARILPFALCTTSDIQAALLCDSMMITYVLVLDNSEHRCLVKASLIIFCWSRGREFLHHAAPSNGKDCAVPDNASKPLNLKSSVPSSGYHTEHTTGVIRPRFTPSSMWQQPVKSVCLKSLLSQLQLLSLHTFLSSVLHVFQGSDRWSPSVEIRKKAQRTSQVRLSSRESKLLKWRTLSAWHWNMSVVHSKGTIYQQ